MRSAITGLRCAKYGFLQLQTKATILAASRLQCRPRFEQQRQCCAATATADQGTMQQGSKLTKVVLVVAVALIDQSQRVLLAQRPEGKAMAGLWEFPGGKVISPQ
jgi:adenine-specific DNA glycosylase